MAVLNIDKCDLCETEQRSDRDYKHWTQGYGNIHLNLKNVPRVQSELQYYVCPRCAEKIRDAIYECIAKLRGPKP